MSPLLRLRRRRAAQRTQRRAVAAHHHLRRSPVGGIASAFPVPSAPRSFASSTPRWPSSNDGAWCTSMPSSGPTDVTGRHPRSMPISWRRPVSGPRGPWRSPTPWCRPMGNRSRRPGARPRRAVEPCPELRGQVRDQGAGHASGTPRSHPLRIGPEAPRPPAPPLQHGGRRLVPGWNPRAARPRVSGATPTISAIRVTSSPSPGATRPPSAPCATPGPMWHQQKNAGDGEAETTTTSPASSRTWMGERAESPSSPPRKPVSGPRTRRRRTSHGTPDASRSSSRGQAAAGGAPGFWRVRDTVCVVVSSASIVATETDVRDGRLPTPLRGVTAARHTRGDRSVARSQPTRRRAPVPQGEAPRPQGWQSLVHPRGQARSATRP